MVELQVEGLEGAFDVGEVHDPAAGFSYFALHIKRYDKGMAMKSTTLMVIGNIRQAVGGFELKLFENLQLNTPGRKVRALG